MLSPEGPDAAPVYVHKRSILGNTVVIPNETAQDHALSWASRGLLLYMLSMPANWRLNERHLIGQSPKGRDHLRQIVRELEAHGYLRRSAVRGPGGTVSHSIWEVWDTRQEPSEMPPLPETEKPATENPSEVRTQSQSEVYPWTGKPATEKPATENPSYYKRNNLQSELLTKESKNPPYLPAEPEPRRSSREDGTNPRATGTNLRALGVSPRDMGLNPRAQANGHGRAMVPATDQVPKPDRPRTAPKPRDPFASKALPAGVVPADLTACAQLLAEWWSVKSRGRTEVAFTRACAFLRTLGAADRLRSLESAVIGGHQGLFPPRAQPQRRPDPNPGPPMPSYGKGRCTSPHAIDPNTWVPGPHDL